MLKEVVSEVLYRKYRPEKFEEILGQEEVVLALENSLKNKNVAHAYLFSGGRGSGKTTTARIFAKDLGISPSDTYEIDAASNRGIDQIRELRNTVQILPLESSHKIYIIDEVHMLTKEAFNALLKTLEEPPKHVIFILATTERKKILDTVISRCQILNFKKANRNKLEELIERIALEEKIEIDKKSKEYIAELGDGSFRDVLSHFQKIISILGNKINFKNLKNLFGSEKNFLEWDFIENLSEKKKEKLFAIYKEVLKNDLDLVLFIENILKKVRAALLIKNSAEFFEYYSNIFNQDEIEKLKSFNKLNSLDLKSILNLLDLAKKSNKPDLAFEIFLLEI